MNRFKNEQGAALVLTLFIVTLLLLFILTQIYQVTNTAKQVSTMEKNIDAGHIAEMGILYFQRSIEFNKNQLQDNKGQAFIEKINTLDKSVEIDRDRFFEITDIKIKPNTITPETNEIVISFSSEGKAHNKHVTKESKITINIIE